MKENTTCIHISEACVINPPFEKNRIKESSHVSFIPMSGLDELSGKIVTCEEKPLKDVLRGFTPFNENDILFAKITPCMENGKVAIARNLKNGIGFGSTEFHVLRPKTGIISEWIYYYLRSRNLRKAAEQNMTGSAGQKRVPKQFFDKAPIPIPSIVIQNRIVSILYKIENAIQNRRKANALTDQFLKSAFLDMFGDPIRNPKGWENCKFEDLGKIERGRSKHRPRNAPKLLGGNYPLIQTGDIANSSGYIKEYKQTYSEIGLKQSRIWPVGTLCITIAANIAKTGILAFDSCFPDSVVGFTPNENNCTEYIQFWLSFLQKGLEKTAPESAQKNINLEILKSLKVPVPPIELQQKFAILVQKVEEIKEKQKKSEQQLQDLFNCLMQKAFKEELVN